MRFSLREHEVPEPPTGDACWIDKLRWMICIMDHDDKRLPFVAGCFAHAMKHGGITPKQFEICDNMICDVYSDWRAGVLLCQNRYTNGSINGPDDDPEFKGVVH